MRTLQIALGIIAMLSSGIQAQTWLINLNNDTGYRGASQNGTDSNGNTWNNLNPSWWSALTPIYGGANTGNFRANLSGTTAGVDSFNGPVANSGNASNLSNPLTQSQIDSVVIDSTALGILGGSKAAAAGYATSNATTGWNFYIGLLNSSLKYDVSFYGAHRYGGTSIYSAYSDGNFTTLTQNTTLNVGSAGVYNSNRTATLTGLSTSLTVDSSQGLNLRVTGANGTAGYLNALSVYGYLGYIDGSATTLNSASSYVANGNYSSGTSRSVDTVIGGGSSVTVNNVDGIYYNSSLVIRSGGATLNAGVDYQAWSLNGNGDLTVGGANKTTFLQAGTFTGNLTLGGGKLQLNSDGALGTGKILLQGGTLRIGSAAALGSGNLSVVSGTTTLENYNGLTALTGNNAINLSGGTFQVNGYGQVLNLGSGNVTVAGTTNLNAWSGGMRFDGVVAGSGSLSWYGGGNLSLGGANTFTGTITAQGNNGSLILSNTAALQTATLNFGGNHSLVFGVAGTNTYQLGGLTGSGSINLGDNSLSITSNASGTYSGTLSGNGGVTILGNGNRTFSGSNTYTGATLVNSGRLIVNGSLATGSTVTVASGAGLSGNGTIGGATTVNGNLAAGNSPGTLTFSTSLTLGSTATTSFELNGITRGSAYDAIDINGPLTYGGTLNLTLGSTFLTGNQTFDLFSFSSQSGNLGAINLAGAYGSGTFNNSAGVWTFTDASSNVWTFTQSTGDLAFAAIPEPSSYALLGIAGLAAMAFARKRKLK